MLIVYKISGYIPPFVKIGQVTTLCMKIDYNYVIGRCNGDSVPCEVHNDAKGNADEINISTVAYRV
jgi:hypothetical protein